MYVVFYKYYSLDVYHSPWDCARMSRVGHIVSLASFVQRNTIRVTIVYWAA